jgi:putative membrane protein
MAEASATDLAIERTMLAHERTLMAWTRTATSLISFGFTIFTFFHNVRGQQPDSPKNYIAYALIMMGTGLVSLFVATLRHLQDVRELQTRYGAKPRRAVVFLAGVIALLGFLGVASIFYRL